MDAANPRPDEAVGYDRRFLAHPLMPAVFVVVSSVVSNPRNAAYGTLPIAARIPAFG